MADSATCWVWNCSYQQLHSNSIIHNPRLLWARGDGGEAELGAGYAAEGYISMALIWHMKAGCKRLPPTNWKHLHGLDTQCFNSAVVTMDTTSASISFRLHMELCEGHATLDIQIKVSEINATVWTISVSELYGGDDWNECFWLWGVKIHFNTKLSCS